MTSAISSKKSKATKEPWLSAFRAKLAREVPPGISLVDELLAERRDNAQRE